MGFFELTTLNSRGEEGMINQEVYWTMLNMAALIPSKREMGSINNTINPASTNWKHLISLNPWKYTTLSWQLILDIIPTGSSFPKFVISEMPMCMMCWSVSVSAMLWFTRLATGVQLSLMSLLLMVVAVGYGITEYVKTNTCTTTYSEHDNFSPNDTLKSHSLARLWWPSMEWIYLWVHILILLSSAICNSCNTMYYIIKDSVLRRSHVRHSLYDIIACCIAKQRWESDFGPIWHG